MESLLQPPPADVLRSDSRADPELLNRYLRLQIQLLEKIAGDSAEQRRKQTARARVLEKVAPAAFWVLLLAVVAVVVSAQNWTIFIGSLGQHPTLTALSSRMEGLGALAGQAVTYKELLIPVFLFVSALALRMTTTRIQGTAIVIGLSTVMMLTLYVLADNADLEWSWRLQVLFFVVGVLIALGLIQRLGTIELQLYRGTNDQWAWFRSLPRRFPWVARSWTATCWLGSVIRGGLRLSGLRLIGFLAVPVIGVFVASSGFLPGTLRLWVSLTLFSIWILWGYLAVVARPGMLHPRRGSGERRLFLLLPTVSLLALLAASTLYGVTAENSGWHLLWAFVSTLAGLLLVIWSPWGLAVAVTSDRFFQPSRRPAMLLVFASVPVVSALILIVGWLLSNGFRTGISSPAFYGPELVLTLVMLFLYPLWLLWAFGVLPTGLRQTYVSLFIWLVIASFYGPGLFMAIMLLLFATSVPVSVWRSRRLFEEAGAPGQA